MASSCLQGHTLVGAFGGLFPRHVREDVAYQEGLEEVPGSSLGSRLLGSSMLFGVSSHSDVSHIQNMFMISVLNCDSTTDPHGGQFTNIWLFT